jgi:hypothetical protein
MWMSEYVNEWVCEWVSMWMSEYVNEWVCEWMSMWMSEYVNEWVCEWVSKCVSTLLGGDRCLLAQGKWQAAAATSTHCAQVGAAREHGEWVSEWVSEWVMKWNEEVSEWEQPENHEKWRDEISGAGNGLTTECRPEHKWSIKALFDGNVKAVLWGLKWV